MRILICTNAWPPHFVGGAELVAHAVACEWLAKGHDVRVFAGDMFSALPHYAVESGEHDGLLVHRVSLRSEDFNAKALVGATPAVDEHFEGVLCQFKPDIVHCHNLAGLSLRLPSLAAQHGARVFMTLHDFWGICPRNTLLRGDNKPCEDDKGCARCLLPEADAPDMEIKLRLRRDLIAMNFACVEAFIAPSLWLAERYRGYGIEDKRLRVMPNGVDTVRFSSNGPQSVDGEMTIIYAGHLAPHKGLHVVLQAMALAKSTVFLHIVGEGPQEPALRTLAARLNLKDRVKFRGRMQPEGMPSLYAQADAVVLGALWHENQPVCIMEGMASGLPVIASRVGGIPGIVEDGEEGVLVPPGDPHAMADAFDKLSESKDLRRRMGQRAQERVRGQSYAHQAKLLMELFSGPRAKEDVLPRPLVILMAHDSAGISVSGRQIFKDESYVIQPPSWLTNAQAEAAEMVILDRQGALIHKIIALFTGGLVNLRAFPDSISSWLLRHSGNRTSHGPRE